MQNNLRFLKYACKQSNIPRIRHWGQSVHHVHQCQRRHSFLAKAVSHQEEHIDGLNQEQLLAVTAPLGCIKVIAGPGSGKTRVLTSRIAHLLNGYDIHPWNLVAITFTNKAANEMKERLSNLLGPATSNALFAGTFHGFAYRLLQRALSSPDSKLECGRRGDFVVYDQDASISVLKKLVKAEHPDWKSLEIRRKAKELNALISKVKNTVQTSCGLSGTEIVLTAYQKLYGSDLSDYDLKIIDSLSEWYDKYEEELKRLNAVDFDDLLNICVTWMKSDPESLQMLRRRFRHLLVDEFQDTNTSQYEMVRLLGGGGGSGGTDEAAKSVFVVGDPDQSIYGWRGSDVENIQRRFDEDFPSCQTFYLVNNYRSTRRIVDAAQRVIARSVGLGNRPALRPLLGAGEPLRIQHLPCDVSEAKWLVDQIRTLLLNGSATKEEDIAVLVRTHHHAKLIEKEMVEQGIKYVLVGGLPFWRRTEVLDLLAYLRMAVTLKDDLALERIINVPKRGFGKASWEKLSVAAKTLEVGVSDLLFSEGEMATLSALNASVGLSSKNVVTLDSFRDTILQARKVLVDTGSIVQTLLYIIQKVEYEAYIVESVGGGDKSEGNVLERQERIQQLVAAAKEYAPGSLAGIKELDWDLDSIPAAAAAAATYSVNRSAIDEESSCSADETALALARGFLDEAALYSGSEDGASKVPGVRLSTMHAAKGLEFPYVFIPGCTNGNVPLMRADLELPFEEAALAYEEERRLFYVSMTRAKRALTLSVHSVMKSRGRPVNVTPSDFLVAIHSVPEDVELKAPRTMTVQSNSGVQRRIASVPLTLRRRLPSAPGTAREKAGKRKGRS